VTKPLQQHGVRVEAGFALGASVSCFRIIVRVLHPQSEVRLADPPLHLIRCDTNPH